MGHDDDNIPEETLINFEKLNLTIDEYNVVRNIMNSYYDDISNYFSR